MLATTRHLSRGGPPARAGRLPTPRCPRASLLPRPRPRPAPAPLRAANYQRMVFTSPTTQQLDQRRAELGLQQADGAEGASVTPSEAEAALAAGGTGKFEWSRHWWPLMPLSCLEDGKPTPIMLLGKPLVVWRGAPGQPWVVMRDACPHRLAPLSEGYIERDGTLTCAYHGWQFNACGACTRIPQSLSPAAQATACASCRSAATVFPTREEAGLLWVWPDDAADAAVAAASEPTPLTGAMREQAALAEEGAVPAVAWYMRDFNFGFETLLENSVDPSHVPFSHHGWGSIDRSLAKPFPVREVEWATSAANPAVAAALSPGRGAATPAAAAELARTAALCDPGSAASGHAGAGFCIDYAAATTPHANWAWMPPNLNVANYRFGDRVSHQAYIFAPVAPGRSRIFSAVGPYNAGAGRTLASADSGAGGAGGGAGLAAAAKAVAGTPAAAASRPLQAARAGVRKLLDPDLHLALHDLYDGDAAFLPLQERNLRAAAAAAAAAAGQGDPNHPVAAPWRKAYYMPTQADTPVRTMRTWMEGPGGGGPFGPPTLSTAASTAASGPIGDAQRRVWLDRWSSHTEKCPSCRARHARLQALMRAGAALRAALAGAVAAAALLCAAAPALLALRSGVVVRAATSAATSALAPGLPAYSVALAAGTLAVLLGAWIALGRALLWLRAQTDRYSYVGPSDGPAAVARD